VDRLATLVDRVRAAGQPVDLAVRGARRLPAEVESAAYRVVQEALTNVRRHAPAAAARVQVMFLDDRLVLQVDNDEPPAPAVTAIPEGADNDEPTSDTAAPVPAGGGTGLVGMRERVTALGGTVRCGPRGGGGFRVRAELPAGDQAGDLAAGAVP
jgi:signal transduction histidine kinase